MCGYSGVYTIRYIITDIYYIIYIRGPIRYL